MPPPSDTPPSEAGAQVVDVGGLLDQSRWGATHTLVFMLIAMAVVFDGLDVQLLGFAMPSLMREWGLERQAFAPVVAANLAGMAIGTTIAGALGDRFGRKVALIGSVIVFSLFTLATVLAQDLFALGVLRLLAGLGLGGGLPNAAALLAEFAPARRRSLAVTLLLVCVPLGGVLGGFISAAILPTSGWKALFVIGGVLPLIGSILLWAFLPESVRFLVTQRRRVGELRRVLRRLGLPVPDKAELTAPGDAKSKGLTVRALLSRSFGRDTLGLWLAFLTGFMTAYAILNWLPSLLTGAGYDLRTASSALGNYNLGGIVGSLAAGWLMQSAGSRISLISSALAAALGALALMLLPPAGSGSDWSLYLVMAWMGAGVSATNAALMSLAAQIYPLSIRATGVGAGAAVGRIGGIASSFAIAAVVASAGAFGFYAMLAIWMTICALGLAIIRRHVPGAGKAGRAGDAPAI